jgi:hypothetical protein
MLLENIPGLTVPIVEMSADQSRVVQGEFAPARDRNSRVPRQGSRPTECPIGANLMSGLLEVVEFERGTFEKTIDQANHLFVFFHPTKFCHGVFEKYVFSVEAVGLVLGEAIVVLTQGGEEIHGLGAADKFNLTDVELTILPVVEWFQIAALIVDGVR